MNRWRSPAATAPLWVPGLILMAVGLVLVLAAVRTVRRGQ